MLHAMGKRDVGIDAPTKVFLLSINVARRDACYFFENKICLPRKRMRKEGGGRAGVKDTFCSRDRIGPILMCKIKVSFCLYISNNDI